MDILQSNSMACDGFWIFMRQSWSEVNGWVEIGKYLELVRWWSPTIRIVVPQNDAKVFCFIRNAMNCGMFMAKLERKNLTAEVSSKLLGKAWVMFSHAKEP